MKSKNNIEYRPEGSIEDSLSFLSNQITPLKAKRLQEKLKFEPNDLATRILLLEYFERARVFNRDKRTAEEQFFHHLVWLIDNHPRHLVHDNIFGRTDNQSYRAAKSRWLRQVRFHPRDVAVLYHASQFCCIFQFSNSEKFLKRATILDEHNDLFPFRLAQMYSLKSHKRPRPEQQKLALQAVKYIKTAVYRYADCGADYSPLQHDFDVIICEIADLAIRCKLLREAKELAALLMEHGEIEKRRGTALTAGQRKALKQCSEDLAVSIYEKIALKTKNLP